jgi:flagellar biosynthesis component FlhA
MEMNYLKVEGHNNLLRDPHTNSIINTNMTEYQQYLARRNVKNDENQKLQNLEEDMSNMKSDLNEIKSLLRSLINESR